MLNLISTVEALNLMYEGIAGQVDTILGPPTREGALDATAQPRQTAPEAGSSGHETKIGFTDDGALENPMARVHILKDRTKFRVRVIDRETGRMTSTIHESEEEARATMRKIKREYSRPTGIEFSKALGEYELFLREKGNRVRSIQTTIQRLTGFFEGVKHTDDLTHEVAARIWTTFTTTPTRAGKVPAVDTARNTLNQAKTFVAWMVGMGWTKIAEPLGKIVPTGRRKRGKPQLVGIDESRRFLAKALELGRAGDAGAVAAAMALLMGMRASEIADRVVRELDDGGRILLITHAKTEAGVRRLMVPAVLQPLLAQLAKGKAGDARLFDGGRHWVLRAVARVCRAAGVAVVPAHGLRGTHATLAVGVGLSGPAVAAALGHESFAITERSYARAEAVEGARAARVLDALN